VAGGRWTDERKKAIFDSRVRGTNRLVKTLASLKEKPKIFVSASAIGYYGDRPGETLTEDSPPGTGFLAHTSKCWEEEIFKAEALGIRTAAIRIGIVLGQDGGILEKTVPIFKKGLGGPVGSGKQLMSWIHVSDLVNIFIRIFENDELRGIFNGVAPNPATNAQFSKTLGKVLNRPAVLKTPAFVLKLLFGEMSNLLLESQDISAGKILATGFQFQYPRLEPALGNILKG
jgi:hypothetical protein